VRETVEKHYKLKNFISQIVIMIILIAYSCIVIFPMLWTVYTSFKTNTEFYENPFSLPKQLSAENYVKAIIKARIGDYFINSVVITAVSIVFILILSMATAYVVARFKTIYTNFLKNLYLGGLLVPTMFVLVPEFLLLNRMHILDTRVGLVIVYVAFSLSFTIFVLTAFFRGISKDYEESALIDGCSYYGILIKIIAPMARPAIITVTIFNFLGLWNEYNFALIVVSSESKRTIPVGLAYLMEVQRYSTDWGALFAGLVIVMIPTIIVYALLQNKITSGLNVGGLKG